MAHVVVLSMIEMTLGLYEWGSKDFENKTFRIIDKYLQTKNTSFK